MTDTNKEREDKALPDYVSLSERQGLHDSELKKQGESIARVESMLISLHRYHGNPEKEKGWLEMIYDESVCQKELGKERHTSGIIISVLVIFISLIIAGYDLYTTGKLETFKVMWQWVKGLV